MNEKCNISGNKKKKEKIYLQNQSCLTQNYWKIRRINILFYFSKSIFCIILTTSEVTNKYQKLLKDAVYFILIAESNKRRVNAEQSLNFCEKQCKPLSESFFPNLKWEQLISLLEKNEFPKMCFLSLAWTPTLNATAEIPGMFPSDTWGICTFQKQTHPWFLPGWGCATSALPGKAQHSQEEQSSDPGVSRNRSTFSWGCFITPVPALLCPPGMSTSPAQLCRQLLQFPMEFLLCQQCPGCPPRRERKAPLPAEPRFLWFRICPR